MLRRAAVAWQLAIVLFLSGGPLASCVAFLDDVPTIGQRCHFSGETQTNCGYCVATQCQKSVNSCCSGTSCPALDDLDGCAGSLETGHCAALRAPTGASSADNKLRSCVASNCNSECTSPRAIPQIGCYALTLPGEPPSCSCGTDIPMDRDQTACSESSPAGSLCCADLGWPGEGLNCSCQTLRCKDSSAGCTCSAWEDGPYPSCTGTYCCAGVDSCNCGSEPCSSIASTVPSCSAQTLPCSTDQKRVSACSE
jgi:hypothetical protein